VQKQQAELIVQHKVVANQVKDDRAKSDNSAAIRELKAAISAERLNVQRWRSGLPTRTHLVAQGEGRKVEAAFNRYQHLHKFSTAQAVRRGAYQGTPGRLCRCEPIRESIKWHAFRIRYHTSAKILFSQ